MSGLETHSLYALPIPQCRMEEILEQRAHELGVDIRRGHEMVALRQDADAVIVDVASPAGSYQLTSRFLVGADGGSSAVRKLSGIGFPGITDDSFVGRTGQVAIPPPVSDPETGELDVPGLGRLRPASFTRTENGLFAYGMFQPGVYRVAVFEWDQPKLDDSDSITIDELREAVRRVLGSDIPIAELPAGIPVVMSRSTSSNSRQADRYRAGRVFLVGDAAHVHSGVGGPGLNLGMQDVMNLAWKLAAELAGHAPEGLLDTYEIERRPVGERVIMHTRAQTALLSPGAYITALRQLLGELLHEKNNVQHLSDLLSGADVHYDMRTEGEAHPLTGRWMPDLALESEGGPTRIAELMRSARPLLLDLANRADLRKVVADWTDRVDVVAADSVEQLADVVLIRPDGYVAWAAGPETSDATDGLRHALTTWFGPPV